VVVGAELEPERNPVALAILRLYRLLKEATADQVLARPIMVLVVAAEHQLLALMELLQ
jgi:Trm5-related predicted tRNA methylase